MKRWSLNCSCKLGQHQNIETRRDVTVWPGSESISETEQGNTGTRESLTSPHGIVRVRGQPQEQQTGLYRKPVEPEIAIRTNDRRKVVSKPRETEGKEKGEGSLSIPVVPIESREIMTDESR